MVVFEFMNLDTRKSSESPQPKNESILVKEFSVQLILVSSHSMSAICVHPDQANQRLTLGQSSSGSP